MNRQRLLPIAVLAVALPLAGCVTYPRKWDVHEKGPDPYERPNRSIFGFNEGVDDYVLDPLAHGWQAITFEGLRKSVNKFFINLGFPRRFVANLGQGQVKEAGSELGRFVLNTTVGLVGFFDPATHLGMKRYEEDFGQMFGRWGIGTGPYWVLPLLGPSNPRDTVGLAFDTLFDVRTIAAVTPVVTLAWTGVVDVVNRRAIHDEDIDKAREASLDFYVFTRDAYLDRRKALIANEDVRETLPAPIPGDLYEFENGEDAQPEAESGAPDVPAETPPDAEP